MTQTTPIQSTPRVRSLDGLRGVAALVVVLTHAFSLFPSLGAVAFLGGPVAPTGSPLWFMVHSPIHLIWSGAAAVVVFFVLSGAVLTIPLMKPNFNWIAYYPHRILRLYLPIIAAVILAYVLILAIPRDQGTGNFWLEFLPKSVSKGGFVDDITVINGTTGAVSTLWSLRYEVLFSLALPIYAGLALVWRGYLVPKLLLTVAAISVGGFINQPFLIYLPMFLLGVFLVTERHTVSAIGQSIRDARFATAWWFLILSGALLLLMSWWIVVLSSPPSWAFGAMYGPTAFGATLLVFLATEWTGLQRSLSTRPVLWLGTVSFSLYLVHEPIVISARYLFGPDWLILESIGAVIVSLGVAQIFYMLIEGPSHRFSQSVRRRIVQRLEETTSGSPRSADADAR